MNYSEVKSHVNRLLSDMNSIFREIQSCQSNIQQLRQKIAQYKSMAEEAMAEYRASGDNPYIANAAFCRAERYYMQSDEAANDVQKESQEITRLKQEMKSMRPQFEECHSCCVNFFNELKVYIKKLTAIDGKKYGSDNIKSAQQISEQKAMEAKQLADVCKKYISYIDSI